MAGNARYGPYLALFDATAVDQIVSGGADPGNAVQLQTPEGVVDPTVSSKYGASPTMRVATKKVGTMLGAVGIAGLDCATGMVLGFMERSAGGTFEAGGEKITAAKCFIVPESLSVSARGDAVITYVGFAYSADGTTFPFAYTGTLPAGTPAVSEKFTMGTVTIGGVAIGKVLSYSLEFNIGVRLYSADGNVYPTAVSIVSRNPVATIEVADLGELSTGDLSGAEVSTVVFNLLARSLTGGALAGSGDKTISMAKAWLDISQVREAADGDCGLTMTARARKDGATAILVVA